MALRVAKGFDPLKAKIAPEEYFVLSRVDGAQTIRQILLATGLPVERGIAILTRLRSLGALLLPGEHAPPPPPAPVEEPTARLPPSILRVQVDAPTQRRAAAAPVVEAPPPAAPGPALPDPTPAEVAALTEDNDIPDAERRLILALSRLVDAGSRDAHALLGVARGADAKTLKRNYFQLSKRIHPDRYYTKQLGSFRDKLPSVFEAVSRAYAKLTAPSPARQTGAHAAVSEAEQPQTPQEYAAELFDRACSLEVGGDPLEAMKLFAAAVRVDPHLRYLRRAASCAIAAGQPKSAVEYAKKAQSAAPDDPSAARLLAAAFRAAGKLADAEEVLVLAMAMKSENDTLTSELRNDLADVRRLLASS